MEGFKMKAMTVPFAILLLACTPEALSPVEAPSDLLPMTFTAAGEASTKTALSDAWGILWSSSDAITLFAQTGKAGQEFKVSSVSDGGRVASFSGLSPQSSNGYYYALNPASSSARLVSTAGTVTAGLPAKQSGVENSFDPAAHLAIARVNADASGADDVLHFKNACALLSFTVPGNYLNRVVIESRDGSVPMTGPATISYNDGAPEVTPTSASKNYVEVEFGQGTIAKRYYAAVYPGNYSSGIVMTFYNTDNKYNRYVSDKPLVLRRNAIVNLFDKDWRVTNDRGQAGTELIAPEIISGGQVSPTSIKIKFSCGSGARDTYKLYVRPAASLGAGTLVSSMSTGANQYGAFEYTFDGLATGASYDVGVSAAATGQSGYDDSPTVWLEDITLNASGSSMTVSIDDAAVNYYNFIVDYSISGLPDAGAEHGLVFSYDVSQPTCGSVGAEGKLPGPVLSSSGDVTITQCVPNACLRPGGTCYLRAYCFDNGNYVYSQVRELTLPAQPEGFSISKTAIASPDSDISLYSFTANGQYKGFAACASLSGGISVGVNNAPMGACSAISLASQMESCGALVLVNGQIFGGQGNIGVAYTGGQLRYNNSSAEGVSNCRGYSNTYTTTWQPVTRAILGVDASGKPGAYWCSVIDGKVYFFDRPIPAGTAGKLVYPQVTASSGPGPARSWSPAEALSTGPMLLYDGKVCVSEDKIATGVYYTNYELWETTSGNIYGSSRQRTAIGFNSASGVFWLVTVPDNITITSMARIMKGLGCDYAMNLDGGLSTQMQVSGTGKLISSDTRNVKSSVGFFRR